MSQIGRPKRRKDSRVGREGISRKDSPECPTFIALSPCEECADCSAEDVALPATPLVPAGCIDADLLLRQLEAAQLYQSFHQLATSGR